MSLRLGKTMRNVLQLTSANVAVKFIGLLMVAFYARYLTKEAAWAPTRGSSALASVVFGLGIHPTLIRNIPPLLETDRAAARGLMYTSAR